MPNFNNGILTIKEGEFEIFKKNNELNLSLFLDLGKDIQNNNSYEIFRIINLNKESILNIFGFKVVIFFPIDVNNALNKARELLDLYEYYNINNYKEGLTKIIIEEDIELENCSSQFLINYIFSSYEKEFKKSLHIKNYNINKTIDKFYIKNNFKIDLISLNENLLIEESNFSKLIEIGKFSNSTFGIKINYCDFKNLSLIKDLGIIVNEIEIKNCNLDKINYGEINIKNFEINSLNIISTNCNKLDIYNNTFKNRVKISSEIQELDDIKKIIINEMKFNSNKINNLRVGHLKIDYIESYNIKNPSDSEINFGNLEIDKLIISNYRNLGKIRFYNINYLLDDNSKNYININNSSFGDSEFQNINMKSFGKNIIYDNLFSDLKYTGVSWGYDIKTSEDEFDEKYDDYIKLRNSYRVLKDVAEENNDNITALNFYAGEMESHKKYLEKKGIYNNFVDWFIVSFNKLSSDYGLNFWKPFIIIVFLNISFMFFVIISSDNFYSTDFTWQNFNNNIGYIIKGFNITNGYDDIFGEKAKSNGLIEFLILLKNILFSAFLYQLILAFRKFSRKV